MKTPTDYKFGPFAMFEKNGTFIVMRGEVDVPLSKQGRRILRVLAAGAPDWIAIETLITQVWGDDAKFETTDQAVYAAMYRLRGQLKPGGEDLIELKDRCCRLIGSAEAGDVSGVPGHPGVPAEVVAPRVPAEGPTPAPATAGADNSAIILNDKITAWRERVRDESNARFRIHGGLDPLPIARVSLEQAFQLAAPAGPGDRPTLNDALRAADDGSLRDLLDADASARCWVVSALPGGGKSTAAHALVATLMLPADPVPIYHSLADQGVEAAIVNWRATEAFWNTMARGDEGLGAALREHSGAKPIWVFLDEFDTVPAARLPSLIAGLRGMARSGAFGNTTVVALGRESSVDRCTFPAEIRVARLRRLGQAQQIAILDRLVPGRGADLYGRIQGHPDLADLAGLPIMCVLIGLYYADSPSRDLATGALAGIDEIYDAGVTHFLEGGSPDDPARRGMKWPSLGRRVLEPLSLGLQRRPEKAWKAHEIEESRLEALSERLAREFTRAWGDASSFLRDVEQTAFLTHDRASGLWRYFHDSFREYLAAVQIHKEPASKGRWLQELASDPANWSEVYGYLCALEKEPIEILRLLDQITPSRVGPTLRGLGRKVPADASFSKLFQSGDWMEADVLALAQIHGPEGAGPALWSQLRPDTPVRAKAIVAYALHVIGKFDIATFVERTAQPQPTFVVATVLVAGGDFTMGSLEGVGLPDERPAHTVTISSGFRIGETEVTRGQWGAFIGGLPDGNACLPATDVSWYEAWLFCVWLGGRLPTEAEWEYACRAGSDGEWPSGDDGSSLAEFAWFADTSGGAVRPVRRLRPNRWGIYDMLGNVWEWCEDDRRAYESKSEVDPMGAPSEHRAVRGGTCRDKSEHCRPADRDRFQATFRWEVLGFRVCFPEDRPRR